MTLKFLRSFRIIFCHIKSSTHIVLTFPFYYELDFSFYEFSSKWSPHSFHFTMSVLRLSERFNLTVFFKKKKGLLAV